MPGFGSPAYSTRLRTRTPRTSASINEGAEVGTHLSVCMHVLVSSCVHACFLSLASCDLLVVYFGVLVDNMRSGMASLLTSSFGCGGIQRSGMASLLTSSFGCGGIHQQQLGSDRRQVRAGARIPPALNYIAPPPSALIQWPPRVR